MKFSTFIGLLVGLFIGSSILGDDVTQYLSGAMVGITVLVDMTLTRMGK